MRADFAFFILAGRASLMSRIAPQKAKANEDIRTDPDGTVRFPLGGGPEVLRAILSKVKK